MRRVYYRSLVNWDKVEAILDLVELHEREETEKLLIGSLDHIVMETILHHLTEELHHDFLELCHGNYDDENLLDWIREKGIDIEAPLKGAIGETKSMIKQLLAEKVKEEAAEMVEGAVDMVEDARQIVAEAEEMKEQAQKLEDQALLERVKARLESANKKSEAINSEEKQS